MSKKPEGPYVVWQNYGCEGWHPSSYSDISDALLATKYNDFVITKIVKFEVVEV